MRRGADARYPEHIRPRFRDGEVVRLARPPEGAPAEGVVEEVIGPDESGSAWAVLVSVDDPRGGRAYLELREDELEPTGRARERDGREVPASSLPAPPERRNALVLRLATDLVDSAEAAAVAQHIDHTLRELAGPSTVEIEAERHWADPYLYELDVTVVPHGDPVEALRRIARAGADGWLSCRDDGWRCDLWWSRRDADAAPFLVPEVRGAEVSFLPWETLARRPESERPLVAVQAAGGYDES